MPAGDTGWLDVLLFGIAATVLGGFAFIGAIEAWRRWSDNRRIRKHLRN
jgi:hypothetical protein